MALELAARLPLSRSLDTGSTYGDASVTDTDKKIPVHPVPERAQRIMQNSE